MCKSPIGRISRFPQSVGQVPLQLRSYACILSGKAQCFTRLEQAFHPCKDNEQGKRKRTAPVVTWHLTGNNCSVGLRVDCVKRQRAEYDNSKHWCSLGHCANLLKQSLQAERGRRWICSPLVIRPASVCGPSPCVTDPNYAYDRIWLKRVVSRPILPPARPQKRVRFHCNNLARSHDVLPLAGAPPSDSGSRPEQHRLVAHGCARMRCALSDLPNEIVASKYVLRDFPGLRRARVA